MRFRRNNGSSVSFFAFQDVITGVAGVMLIVVLLLIVGKRRLAAVAAPVGADETLISLQAQLADVETKLSLSRERLAALRTEARQVDETHRTEQKLRASTRHGQELSEELARRQTEARKLQAKCQTEQSKLAALAPETRQFLELSRERHALQTALRRAKLRLAPETQREAAVLDCARSSWRWERRGEAPIVLGGENAANPTAAWDDLAMRLKSLAPAQSLLLVAVRPSAGGFVMPLVSKIRAEFPDLPLALEAMPGEDADPIRLE